MRLASTISRYKVACCCIQFINASFFWKLVGENDVLASCLMKILVLARLKAGSGNNSTASRIREHLVSGGHNVPIKCVTCFLNSAELNSYVLTNSVEGVLGIHAFRAGELLYDCTVPYVIIFGGTDLNEHFDNEERLQFMTKAVMRARKCVSFNNAMKQRALCLWECIEDKIIVQPQAVEISPSNINTDELLCLTDSNYEVILNNNAVVFLLVAGLRPVKDPLFLVETFSEWHQIDNRIHLLVVGPEIDIGYSKEFKNRIRSSNGIIFIEGLSPSDLQGLMTRAFALVNTSKSEGMANSILEAMHLGVPILARNNDGNAAIIEHRRTGLLFDSPMGFKQLAKELMTCDGLKNDIIENARKYVLENHSFAKERQFYCGLVRFLSK